MNEANRKARNKKSEATIRRIAVLLSEGRSTTDIRAAVPDLSHNTVDKILAAIRATRRDAPCSLTTAAILIGRDRKTISEKMWSPLAPWPTVSDFLAWAHEWFEIDEGRLAAFEAEAPCAPAPPVVLSTLPKGLRGFIGWQVTRYSQPWVTIVDVVEVPGGDPVFLAAHMTSKVGPVYGLDFHPIRGSRLRPPQEAS